MGELRIPSAQAIRAASIADATRIATGGDDIVLRRPMPIDHDQATAWASQKIDKIRDGSDELARLGLINAVLSTETPAVHGKGLGLFFHVVALVALCWQSGPVLVDAETGLPTSPDVRAVQALLMHRGDIYREVSDWAWRQQADWVTEGNGSGLPSGLSGQAARSPEPPTPATPTPDSVAG